MDNFRIKTPRQHRAVGALLEKAVQVKDLGPMVGALNPRQIIFELRQQGFEGVIVTRRFTVKDQDGRLCRPGEYFIPESLKPVAEQALKAYTYQSLKNNGNLFESIESSNDSRED